MSHETFVDTEVVPDACRLITTDDAILICSRVFLRTIIRAPELIKLSQANWFVNFSCSGTSWILLSSSFTSIRIDVEQ